MKRKLKADNAWEKVPHSPTPWRDEGVWCVGDSWGRMLFSYKPSHRTEHYLNAFKPGLPFPQCYGDYHFMLCAVNCHEDLLSVARRLEAILKKAPKKNESELVKLRAIIRHAESNFD